jgi:hypothetical protein
MMLGILVRALLRTSSEGWSMNAMWQIQSYMPLIEIEHEDDENFQLPAPHCLLLLGLEA